MGEGSHIYGTTRRTGGGKQKATTGNRGYERLIAKGDINRGLTKAQEIAVSRIEDKDRHLKTERVTVVDKNGKILARSQSGSYKKTGIPAGNYKDCVITHNHPNQYRGIKQTTDAGSSLSGADVVAAIRLNASEIRAVASGFTYSLRRPKGGWNADPAKISREWQHEWNKSSPDARKYMSSGKNTEDKVRRSQRANTMGSHQVTRELAKKYGWEYTRRRTEKK
jgi:hypothetical protein